MKHILIQEMIRINIQEMMQVMTQLVYHTHIHQ